MRPGLGFKECLAWAVQGLEHRCSVRVVACPCCRLLPATAYGRALGCLGWWVWHSLSVDQLAPIWWFPAQLAELFGTMGGCLDAGCGFGWVGQHVVDSCRLLGGLGLQDKKNVSPGGPVSWACCGYC